MIPFFLIITFIDKDKEVNKDYYRHKNALDFIIRNLIAIIIITIYYFLFILIID